ncbi:MAG: hypothetical protein HYZ21_07540 [Chloroflexi bacterium]|nr:hypothetical protein [Chloroflexota bacterium]
MNELKKLHEELYNYSAPKGFAGLAEDLDILVYEYAAGIMGHTESYLAGQAINPFSIHIDKELDRRLEECLTKLNELKSYKQKHDALAKCLIREISGDSPT